jgi:hypothetical protein
MAVKKKTTNNLEGGSASPPVAETDLAVASGTAPKAGTPEPSATQATPPRPATAKAAAAPVKLTERQLEFLKMIHGTKEPGFLVGRKADQRTIDALMDRKLIKKGAKDRESGNFRYSVSKAGEKHLTSSPPTA